MYHKRLLCRVVEDLSFMFLSMPLDLRLIIILFSLFEYEDVPYRVLR